MGTYDSSERKRVPNQKLRKERERRGLAHKDVAEHIGLPDPHTVGRWERGVSFPQPHYRQKLCQLFDKSAEELGLVKAQSNDDAQPGAPAPAPHTPAGVPTHGWKIPPTFTSFIGREREIDAVCTLLTSSDVRLVTLLGPGGVGKTRLSIQIARRMGERFAGGLCFVSLAAINDPTLVLPTIAHALGMQESGMPSIIEQMKSALRAKQFLLVLDNFEQVTTAAPLVEELLGACPELKVLATSRAVLHLQIERGYPVEPLACPAADAHPTLESFARYAAVDLFVQRVQALLPMFQPAAENIQIIAEICTRLDGLPLALELAAARVKLLPPRALLARLRHGLHFLKSDLHNQTERQHTLYNTIKWSYDLLNEQEQWLFRQLSAFSGGCVLETAEAILNNGQPLDLLDTIASLLDKSLLQQVTRDGEAPRLVMLETVREYGLACLQSLGEKEACQRMHAMHYVDLVEQARPYLNGTQQAEWLARLEQEKENLRTAMSYLIQHTETDAALHFCEPFGKFCGLRGYWGEEQHWLHATLNLPWEARSTAIRARVLRRAGHLAYRMRDFAQARSFLEESVVLSHSAEDRQNLAGALGGLAWVCYRQKDNDSASRLLHEGVTAARESGDTWAIANTLESLGRLKYLQGNTNEAYRLLDESVTLAREIGDKENLARILTTCASIEIARDNITRAAILAQESYELAQKLGTKPLIALVLDSLGDIASSLGEYDRATQLFEERILLARELGDTPTIALKQLRLGNIALAQNNPAQAAALVQESLNSFREQGDRPNIAAALSVLGDIKQAQGEVKEAAAFYQEASREKPRSAPGK